MSDTVSIPGPFRADGPRGRVGGVIFHHIMGTLDDLIVDAGHEGRIGPRYLAAIAER